MELPNRSQLEATFAARVARLSKKQRAELEELLGDPPDYLNVPPEKWKEWEDDNHEELLLLLLLIASASAELHGAPPGASDVVLAVTGWATQRSQETAREISETTQRRLVKFLDEIRDQQIEQEAAELAGDAMTGESATESGSATEEAITEETIQEQLDELLDSLFGKKRAEAIAVNETTAAQHAGGEIGIEATVGISQDDIWRVHPGDSATGPCQTCLPLEGKPRSYWARFFPKGPPSPHPQCCCSVEYANQLKEVAAG